MRLSFLLIISSLAVFLFFLFPITDFDIWFHLADGKFIVENLKAPLTDIYSYTAYGNPAPSNSWGFAALSYLIYKIGGLDALNIVKAIVSFSIFLVIVFYLYKKKILNVFSLLFVVLALFSIRENFSLRPHTFSYLIFIIFLILLFKYKEAKNWKNIFFLVLTQFLWVNFHGSFIWGIILSGIIFASETYSNKKIEKKDLLLVSLVLLISLFNIFYGPNYLFRIARGYLVSFDAPIREHLPPTFQTFISLMGLILLSLFLVIYYNFKEKRIDILLMAIVLSLVALTNARFLRDLILFLCLSAPFYFPKIQIKKINLKIPEKTLAVMYLISLMVIFLLTKNNKLGIGNGLEKFSYPVSGVNFIKNEKILEISKGNLYNTYNFGGYLIWNLPEHKVFVDGRMEPYEQGAFQAYWNNFEGGGVWKESVEKYNIIAALMTLPHTDGKTIYNDSTKMFPKEEWALIYYDDVCMIYVKREKELQDIIEKYEYKIINPQAMDFSYFEEIIKNQEDFEVALEEIKKGLIINPQSYRLHFTASYLFNLAGQQDLLRQELEKTLEINPHFKPAREILDQLSLLND